MSNTSNLEQVVAQARALLGDTPELAQVVATILQAGSDGPGLAATWSQVTGRPERDFNAAADAGRRWQGTPLPALTDQLATDPAAAADSAAALTELAYATAAVEPIDMARVNAAAFTAAAQLHVIRALEALTPPGSLIGTSAPGQVTSNPVVTDPVVVGDPVGAGSLGNDTGPTPTGPTDSSEPVVLGAANPTGETPAAVAGLPPGTAIDPEPQQPPEPTLEELLAELDALTGLATVKSEVHRQTELLRVAKLRAERGMKNPDVSRHLVFTGNPGTGKTTVARLVAKIYRSLGLLDKGHLVEVDRTGLVAGYLGQTEEKTAALVQQALGGVLFIDEAYSLAGDQYGEAAVNTLVKAIEDHRDDLVLIVAGYTEPMQEFIDSNPGLASRLRLTIFFPDYSDDELIEIFQSLAAKSDYSPTDGCLESLRGVLAVTPRDETFGNARFVRNCFEAALVRQAWRLRDVENPTDEELRSLTEADIEAPPPLEPPEGATPTELPEVRSSK